MMNMNLRVFAAFVMLCFVALAANAQKTATVKNFSQTTDHISGSDRRNDLNGTPCALVKVQVADEIERIEGNKIGNIVDRGVEKWVYMCAGSRNIKIHLKHHLPVKVMFQDYHINGLESNRVYELVIDTPNESATDIHNITNQKLTINYSPPYATIMVDSKLCKGNNGQIELELPIGEHSYLIAAEGYITAEGTVKLSERAPRIITEKLTPESQMFITDITQQDNRAQDYTNYLEKKEQYEQPESTKYRLQQHEIKRKKVLWYGKVGISYDMNENNSDSYRMYWDDKDDGLGFEAVFGLKRSVGKGGGCCGVETGFMTALNEEPDSGEVKSDPSIYVMPYVGWEFRLSKKNVITPHVGPYASYGFVASRYLIGASAGADLWFNNKYAIGANYKQSFGPGYMQKASINFCIAL